MDAKWYPEPCPWTPEPYVPSQSDYPATDARSSMWRENHNPSFFDTIRDAWSGNADTDKAWRNQ